MRLSSRWISVSVSTSQTSVAGGGLRCRLEAHSLSSRFALCSISSGRSDWTFVIVFAAGRWRAGAGPAILCGKFRTGHEPAICSSRPSAAKRRNTFWNTLLECSEEGGRRKSAAEMSLIYFFIIHDCRVMRCTERDEVLLPALDGFQFGRLSVFLALHLKYRSSANKTNRQFFI